MAKEKLGRPTKERMAAMRNQVSYLLWNGKLETSYAKCKSVQSMAEKIITLAINTYEDVVTVSKQITDKNGVKVVTNVTNDGPKKLAARRKIMSQLYDIQEVRGDKESLAAFKAKTKDINHPLIEKIFNVYAPKFAARNKEKNCAGGYTRVLKLGARRGDAAEMGLIEIL